MQQENDYLQREIQKLTLFLTKLIGKITDSPKDTFENDVQESNEALQNIFGFSVSDLSDLSNEDFFNKCKTIPEVHLEKISELLFSIVEKGKQTDKNNALNIKTISEKTILLFDYLNTSSGTFSMDRMNKKNTLQKYLK